MDMQLTKAEEQIMQILWTMEEGTVQDILKEFVDPKPARTTIATVLSILENKNFVTHRSEGRLNIYKALVAKEDYSKKQLLGFVKDYFNGSFSSMISFFAKENNLTLEEMDHLLEETRQALDDKQTDKTE
ncbi:transcriptional regulator [Bacteroidia bacterium]|nr:transcriptional regulator [Bacteroidia bacterium]